MKLSGIHFLLTYQCVLECDHCFVWGSPWQSGVMTLAQVRQILDQALELGTVDSIYFEGGEPFLYYPVLVEGVRAAVEHGFQVGIVSNAYWARSVEDALEWLKPFAGLVQDLSISSDRFHWSEELSLQAINTMAAAGQLGIPIGIIQIAQPEVPEVGEGIGQIPAGKSGVMYRGRAAENLARRAPKFAWDTFRECPHEDLVEPGRVHVDPLGYVHICQGITIGNLFETALKALCEAYDPSAHPVIGPLRQGGPLELARRYNLPHAEHYADACQFCYEARRELRSRFPEILAPDQVYGVF